VYSNRLCDLEWLAIVAPAGNTAAGKQVPYDLLTSVLQVCGVYAIAARARAGENGLTKGNRFRTQPFNDRSRDWSRKMNRDTLEGAARSAIGQGEKVVGRALDDRSSTAQGSYDDAMGKARSALGSAKDAVNSGVEAVSALDFSALRDQVGQLAQKVSDLARNGMSPAEAKENFAALEADVESKIKRNPWGAVAIAALIGLLFGKMT
jgi:uncharacterized protein YjbJ (UPF0337 family)